MEAAFDNSVATSLIAQKMIIYLKNVLLSGSNLH